MAIAQSGTESFGAKSIHTTSPGLGPVLRGGLEFFFREYEAAIGQRSTFSAMLAAWSGTLGGGAHNGVEDAMAEMLDRGVVHKGREIYRALVVMANRGQDAELVVLHRLYGPRNPLAEFPVFGDVAPIVDMVPAVDAYREQLALEEGERRSDHLALVYDAAAANRWRESVEEEIAYVNTILERLDAKIEERHAAEVASVAINRSVSDRRRQITAELVEKRASWERFLVTLEIRATRRDIRDSALNARLSALAGADKEITHAAALRQRMVGQGPSDPQARAAFQAARRSFVAKARKEAEGLRLNASQAYVAAREEATRIAPPRLAVVTRDHDNWAAKRQDTRDRIAQAVQDRELRLAGVSR
jgi:hypothetical protein